MKPISLYLAVAAVVALGVACGIFVVLSSSPGDDSGGPLSGAIAVPGPTTVNPTPTRPPIPTPTPMPTPPWPTTITLVRASGKEPSGGSCHQFHLTGVLLDYAGAPVAGRTVGMEFWVPPIGGGQGVWNVDETATTSPNGTFTFTPVMCPGDYGQSTYRAHWTGDQSYAASVSGNLVLQW
jgi:hypothetical protein